MLKFLKKKLIHLREKKRYNNDWKYDRERYADYSATFGVHSKLALEGRITALYHVIEKGLSLKETRPGFGHGVVSKLLMQLGSWNEQGYPQDHLCITTSLGVLKAYKEFNESEGYDLGDLAKKIDAVLEQPQTKGGTIRMTRQELLEHSKGDFAELAKSRHSIRDFDPSVPLNQKDILEAIKIAQRSPSVCNRQSARVHVITDPEKKKAVLDCQEGSRGFGEYVDTVLVLTSDLSIFKGRKERYQSYIDGGIFGMSLLYALQYKGLATCPLNWSAEHEKDLKLRSIVDIPKEENVIFLIAVGSFPEELDVAHSARKSVEDIVTNH